MTKAKRKPRFNKTFKKIPKKSREELEKTFLSSIMHYLDLEHDGGELARMLARYSDVSWRYFTNKRNQLLWRAFNALKLSISIEEREDKIIEDSGHPAKYFVDNHVARKGLHRRSYGSGWIIHELNAAGVLRFIREEYVEEVYKKLSSTLIDEREMDNLAKDLSFL